MVGALALGVSQLCRLPTLDTTAYLYAALFGLSICAITFAGCRWQHARQLREVKARMEKLEAARQTADQHAMQARKQVEGLQKEMAAIQKSRADDLSSRRRVEAMETTLKQEADRRVELSSHRAPPLPNHGFADTQPM